MPSLKFENNCSKVNFTLEKKAIKWLVEASEELISQTVKRSRRKTSRTANSWKYILDKSKLVSIIGNPLENAIWEEEGTGEYALKGDGRKGGWVYRDKITGKFYHTYGKKPTQAFYRSYLFNKEKFKSRALQLYKELK